MGTSNLLKFCLKRTTYSTIRLAWNKHNQINKQLTWTVQNSFTMIFFFREKKNFLNNNHKSPPWTICAITLLTTFITSCLNKKKNNSNQNIHNSCLNIEGDTQIITIMIYYWARFLKQTIQFSIILIAIMLLLVRYEYTKHSITYYTA